MRTFMAASALALMAGGAEAVTVYGDLTAYRFGCLQDCVQAGPPAPDAKFFLSFDTFDDLYSAGDIQSDGYSAIDISYVFDAVVGTGVATVGGVEVGRETLRFESYNFTSYDVRRLTFSTTLNVNSPDRAFKPLGLSLFDTHFSVVGQDYGFGGRGYTESLFFNSDIHPQQFISSGEIALSYIDYNPSSIPLPASAPMIAFALAGLFGIRRRATG